MVLLTKDYCLKKQPPSQVFAGPSGDCGCVSDYPVFRPLRFDDIQGVTQIINSSGNLAIPTFNLYTDNDISADQAGVMAFSTGDNYLMIANGTIGSKFNYRNNRREKCQMYYNQ